METIGTLARKLTWQFTNVIDWAIRNWVITMIFLIILIYWAGRQRRVNRHHS